MKFKLKLIIYNWNTWVNYLLQKTLTAQVEKNVKNPYWISIENYWSYYKNESQTVYLVACKHARFVPRPILRAIKIKYL